MNNIAYDGRNYRRAQMMKRLSDEYFDTSTKYEDIKRAADQAVDVKEDGASPNKSTSIKINEGSESEKTVSIITIGHEGYFPTQAELNIHRDALESLGVRDFILTPYPIDIKKMKTPAPSKEISVGHEIEQIQENLYKCRALLVATEGSLYYTDRDIISNKLLEIDQLLKEAIKPLEKVEGRAIQKHFDQLGESPQADMWLVKDITSAINFHSAENESNTPDFILGQFAADSIAAVNKAIKHRDQLRDSERQADIAGALFDFAGYLTTLEVPMTVGSAHNVNTILDHLTAWSKERGLNLEDANVEKWNKTGSKPEERNPSKSETVSQLVDVARESFRYYTSKPAGMPGIRVKEIKDEEGIKSEATTKIKNEVIEIVRESLKNFVGSPTGTKADADVHVSVDVYPTVPLEYIDVTVELEENVNVF